MFCVAYQHPTLNIRPAFVHKTLVDALSQTGDVKSVVALVHVISLSRFSVDTAEEKPVDEDNEETNELPSRFLNNLVFNSQTRNHVADVLKVSSSSDNLNPRRILPVNFTYNPSPSPHSCPPGSAFANSSLTGTRL